MEMSRFLIVSRSWISVSRLPELFEDDINGVSGNRFLLAHATADYIVK